jgi:internalin A
MARKRWIKRPALLALLLLSPAAWADETALVKAVTSLGGKVEVDNKRPGHPVIAVIFDESKKVTDKDLALVKEFRNLDSLSLNRCLQITDAGLRELKGLKNLHYLWLGGGEKFGETKITDRGLRELKDLKSLKALGLRGTRVTNLEGLKNLTSLEFLNLDLTTVTDQGLKELMDLKNLTTLTAGETKLTDQGLKELKRIKSLTTLALNRTKITDAGLKELKELENLQSLELAFNAITDAGLNDLKEFKRLRMMALNGNKLTEAGQKDLRAALPKTEIGF